jgi:hypothetical protein
MNAMNLLLDIGIGPSGSEEVIISDVWSQYSFSEEIAPSGLPRIFGVDIPAGVRLSARQAKSSVTTNHNCNLIGIPWR